MKILHIASGSSGGAYRAARTLFELQLEFGLDANFLSNDSRGPARKLLSKFVTIINRCLTKPRFGVMSVYSIKGLSFKQIKKINADILHIHNWFNLLSAKQIIKLSDRYPIVITMHDERLITGGCHNHLDCRDFRNSCTSCPALRIPVRRKVRKTRHESKNLLQSKNIRIITPSVWLGKEVELSTLGEVKPFVVANPIRREFYADTQSVPIQNKTHNQNLLFVAANPWVPLKGLSELIASLSEIEKSGEHLFTLNIIGKSDLNVSVPKFARMIGELDGDELTRVMLESDFVVVPSKAENSPGIISEAQFLGRVVVATNVGGVPELVSDLETGILQKKNESLSDLLKRALCTTNQDRELIRIQAQSLAIDRLSKESLIQSTLEIYQEAIRNAK